MNNGKSKLSIALFIVLVVMIAITISLLLLPEKKDMNNEPIEENNEKIEYHEIEEKEDKEVSSTLTLTLKGNEHIKIKKGEKFVEPGYIATDTIEGDLTSKVTFKGSYDINKIGSYFIIYHVQNSRGDVKQTIRTIEVIADTSISAVKISYSPTKLTNKDVVITLTINGDNYESTTFPDGKTSKSNKITYTVSKNGTYSFKVKEKNGHVETKKVAITNIDKTKPTGSCVLTLYDKNGSIKVTAKDNNELKGYIYKYGINKSKLVTSTTHKVATLDDEANVLIYDQADNYSDIKCTVSDKSSKLTRSYTLKTFTSSKGAKYEYWFYTPKDNTVRKKMPLLVYLHGDGGRKNIYAVNLYAFPGFVKNGMDFPFYMIAPHVSFDSSFTLESVMERTIELIKNVESNYNIDVDRIIISGGSSGSQGAYLMAAKYKKMFSCMLIGSGIKYGIDPANLTHLPIWFLHGKSDSGTTYTEISQKVSLIKAAGGNAKLTVVNGGHDITETAFKKPEVIEWMITQRKSNNK